MHVMLEHMVRLKDCQMQIVPVFVKQAGIARNKAFGLLREFADHRVFTVLKDLHRQYLFPLVIFRLVGTALHHERIKQFVHPVRTVRRANDIYVQRVIMARLQAL